MTCPDWNQRSLYYDGELTDQTVSAHIEGCLACRSELRKLEEMEACLTSPLSGRTTKKSRAAWKLVAAAAILVGGLGLALRPTTSQPNVTRMATRDGTVYTVSTTGQARLLSLEVNGNLARPEEN